MAESGEIGGGPYSFILTHQKFIFNKAMLEQISVISCFNFRHFVKIIKRKLLYG